MGGCRPCRLKRSRSRASLQAGVPNVGNAAWKETPCLPRPKVGASRPLIFRGGLGGLLGLGGLGGLRGGLGGRFRGGVGAVVSTGPAVVRKFLFGKINPNIGGPGRGSANGKAKTRVPRPAPG